MTRDEFVRALFRAWSPFYDLALPQRLFYRPIHRRLIARLRGSSAARAIDLGCGTAQLTVDVAATLPGALVTGVDLSGDMLRAAHVRLGAASPPLVRANVYALPFAGGSVDVVTSSISYHWYREPDRALAEIARVLRPGGRLLLATMTGAIRTISFGAAVWTPLGETRDAIERAGFRVTAADRLLPIVTLFDATKI